MKIALLMLFIPVVVSTLCVPCFFSLLETRSFIRRHIQASEYRLPTKRTAERWAGGSQVQVRLDQDRLCISRQRVQT